MTGPSGARERDDAVVYKLRKFAADMRMGYNLSAAQAPLLKSAADIIESLSTPRPCAETAGGRAPDGVWQSNMQNAWASLRMIRETIETLGPPGILPSEEAVLGLHGPEPVHEATVIVEALRTLLATIDVAPTPPAETGG